LCITLYISAARHAGVFCMCNITLGLHCCTLQLLDLARSPHNSISQSFLFVYKKSKDVNHIKSREEPKRCISPFDRPACCYDPSVTWQLGGRIHMTIVHAHNRQWHRAAVCLDCLRCTLSWHLSAPLYSCCSKNWQITITRTAVVICIGA
jgi:hypothetical protein